jgi:antitoxin component YwqK of YwqJK toxin-antitoxin module
MAARRFIEGHCDTIVHMRSATAMAVYLGVVAASGAARASGNICFYNGKPADGPHGNPASFTGEYTCKDMDSGKLTLREHRVGGLRNGDYATYNPRDGKLDETGRYREDKLDGPLRRYRDGALAVEYNYVAGKRAGLQREFKDGKLSRIYLMGEDGRPDTQLHYNKTGQLTMLECKAHPIGKEDAVWCGFNGQQSTVSLYSDDGRLRATVQYLAGREHGLQRRFNVATGAVIEEVRYENGKRLADGASWRDRTGALLVKTECDAQKTCTETQFFAGGTQRQRVTVRIGARVIKRTSYYQNGKPEQELIADGGKLRITDFRDTGSVATKGTYIESDGSWSWSERVPDGVIESFDDAGGLSSRTTYVHGRRQGRSERFWIADGHKLRLEADFDKDQLIRERQYSDGAFTSETEYFPDGSLKSHKDHAPPQPPAKI